MPRQDGSPTIPEMLGFKDHDEMRAAHEAQAADRTDKPWPPEEDCPGCPNHRDGPHKMECAVRGKQQVVLPVVALAMPDRTFAELFTEVRPWVQRQDGHADDVEPDTDIGHYLAVSGKGGHRGFWVKPAPFLVAWIEANMLRIDNDRKYFEVVIRDDDTALVLVKYNVILGSRWMTIVPASTLTLPEAS